MPTICPNCLRPVRNDARYCGYCGTNLFPAAQSESVAVMAPVQAVGTPTENPLPSKKMKSRGGKARRIILIILIVLLCLVLLVAFLAHYWPQLLPYLGSWIASLFRR